MIVTACSVHSWAEVDFSHFYMDLATIFELLQWGLDNCSGQNGLHLTDVTFVVSSHYYKGDVNIGFDQLELTLLGTNDIHELVLLPYLIVTPVTKVDTMLHGIDHPLLFHPASKSMNDSRQVGKVADHLCKVRVSRSKAARNNSTASARTSILVPPDKFL